MIPVLRFTIDEMFRRGKKERKRKGKERIKKTLTK